MKFNKWTLGLAAVGVVSLTSAARADESKPSALQTALSNTTISGYVSASANVGLTGNYAASPAGAIPFQAGKENGFNLDVVKLVIAKPEDATPWASGYEVDLLFGPDAVGYNRSANAVTTTASTGTATGTGTVNTTGTVSQGGVPVVGATTSSTGTVNTTGTANTTGTGATLSDFGIKQAFITLNTPIGNGIDFKVGVFDSPLGYEVFDSGSNPNYTRSWGYDIEPTELTGVSATYKINDEISVNGGVANTSIAGINSRNTYEGGVASTWHEAYFGDVTLTAPSSWGWAAGSSLFAGVLYGAVDSGNYMGGNQLNYYGGILLNTPLKALTGGVAFDYVRNFGGGLESPGTITDKDVWALGLYTTYKATDKLSFSGRAEYVEGDYYINTVGSPDSTPSQNLVEVTGTVEYDLWANVQTRVEARWDQNLSVSDGLLFGSTERDSVGLYANIIYKF